MPKKYPPEFKRDVVTVARRGDLSVAEVAIDFGVAEETVRRWMKQADVDDGIKDGLTTAEQAEIVQLRRDKRRLEMENEILKRASAYFARENVLPNWGSGWSRSSPLTVCLSRWPAGSLGSPPRDTTNGGSGCHHRGPSPTRS